MYVHLGAGTSIRAKNIVGIFDLETSTISKITRGFLKNAEDSLLVTDVCEGFPKSFILWEENAQIRVFISRISSQTLQKRLKSVIPADF